MAALAALVKPQFGVVLIPLVAVVLLRRHLLRRGSGPRHGPWGPARLRRGWSASRGWPAGHVGRRRRWCLFALLLLPFGMGILDSSR